MGSGSWVVKTKENGTVEFPLDKADDKNEAIQYALDQLNYDNVQKRTDKPKFGNYQLAGEKENYKEVLITLPNITPLEIKEVSLGSGKGYQVFKGAEGITKRFATRQEAEKALDFYKENEWAKPSEKNQFKSSHWDEPNILVHLRMNTRKDAEGRKVLFVEEVQMIS